MFVPSRDGPRRSGPPPATVRFHFADGTTSLGCRFEGPSRDRSAEWTGRARGASNESGPTAGSRTRTPNQGPCAATTTVLAELADLPGDRPHRRAPAASFDERDRAHNALLLAVPGRRSDGQGPDRDDRRQRGRCRPADGRHRVPLPDPGRPAGQHCRSSFGSASRAGHGTRPCFCHGPIGDPELAAAPAVRRAIHLPRQTSRAAAGRRAWRVDRLAGQALRRGEADDTLLRRCRVRGREAGGRRGRGLPEAPEPLLEGGSDRTQGRADGRSSGDGQDAHGPGRRRRGRGPVLLGHRVVLHRDLRRRRRVTGA